MLNLKLGRFFLSVNDLFVFHLCIQITHIEDYSSFEFDIFSYFSNFGWDSSYVTRLDYIYISQSIEG